MHPGQDSEPIRSPDASDPEELILVDDENNVVGHAPRSACHEGDGILHRAFSVFLFDRRGRVLIQRRSDGKDLWPLHWSNSVCSHPRRGEDEDEAVRRRIREELGAEAAVELLYRFAYHARFGSRGSEREHCSVYVGRVHEPVHPDSREIAEWRWETPDSIDRELARDPERFTPWMRMEWERLRGDLQPRVSAYVRSTGGVPPSSAPPVSQGRQEIT